MTTSVKLERNHMKTKRKQFRYKQHLSQSTDIIFSDVATKCLLLCNAGLNTGNTEEEVLELFLPYGCIKQVAMVPNQSYSFIEFESTDSANKAFKEINGIASLKSDCNRTLYLLYLEQGSIPNVNHEKYQELPKGLMLLKEFVTEDEEKNLLSCIKWDISEDNSGQVLKHRRVKHYGYAFRYDTSTVDKENCLPDNIPEECIKTVFKPLLNGYIIRSVPDQLTVNQYLPGQGIPPHIDTHSSFEDQILSLSLGSSLIMDFKHPNGQHIPVFLPQRSLLIMDGESRYLWTHGITPKKSDVIQSASGGLSLNFRSTRTSFTFRTVRRNLCNCVYSSVCDSQKNKEDSRDIIDPLNAEKLEKLHVQEVYDKIADHFSKTRHTPWPRVRHFVTSLPSGSILIDIGCGNGKYLGLNKNITDIGCDTGESLMKICQGKGHNVLVCNCLSIPLKSSSADACLSIAVIHHLATEKRRLQAVQEMVRLLKPSSDGLIYVWAKEQGDSVYLKENKKILVDNSDIPNTFSLPVHLNRTNFQHSDLLVPWISKSSDSKTIYHRYYHVFESGELEYLCNQIQNIQIVNSYYDQGNWCVRIKKIC